MKELSPGNRASMDAMSNGTFNMSRYLPRQRRKRDHRCTIRSRRKLVEMRDRLIHERILRDWADAFRRLATSNL